MQSVSQWKASKVNTAPVSSTPTTGLQTVGQWKKSQQQPLQGIDFSQAAIKPPKFSLGTFIKDTAKEAAKLPLRMGASVADIGLSGAALLGSEKAKTALENTKKQGGYEAPFGIGKVRAIGDTGETVDIKGTQFPATSLKDIAGAGAEAASYLPIARLPALGAQALKQTVIQGAKAFAKEGAIAGGVGGAGHELQNPESTFGSVAEAGAIGSLGGAVLGGALGGSVPILGRGVTKLTGKKPLSVAEWKDAGKPTAPIEAPLAPESARTAPIAPKVSPLAAEARKYKSAEEFVKGQGTPVYHGSNKKFESVDDIDFKDGFYTLRRTDEGIASQRKYLDESLSSGISKTSRIEGEKLLSPNEIKEFKELSSLLGKRTSEQQARFKELSIKAQKEALNREGTTVEKEMAKYEKDPATAFGKEVTEFVADFKNPLIIDFNGKGWRESGSLFDKTTEQINNAKKNGHDGVIIKNISEGFTFGADRSAGLVDDYIVLDKSALKTKSQLTDIWNKATKGGGREISIPSPLAKEAQKYSSAVDVPFDTKIPKTVDNLYHATTPDRLNSIVKNGITSGNKSSIAGEGVSGEKNISLAGSEKQAAYYVEKNRILLRTKAEFDPTLEHDTLGGAGNFITKENIPPNMLEIKTKDGWQSLTDFYNKAVGTSKTTLPKQTDSLAAEARKYKSAEEFVKAQTKSNSWSEAQKANPELWNTGILRKSQAPYKAVGEIPVDVHSAQGKWQNYGQDSEVSADVIYKRIDSGSFKGEYVDSAGNPVRDKTGNILQDTYDEASGEWIKPTVPNEQLKNNLLEKFSTKEGKAYLNQVIEALPKNPDGSITAYRIGSIGEGAQSYTLSEGMAKTFSNQGTDIPLPGTPGLPKGGYKDFGVLPANMVKIDPKGIKAWSPYDAEILVESKYVKTKSQLTDIWNKAQGTTPKTA